MYHNLDDDDNESTYSSADFVTTDFQRLLEVPCWANSPLLRYNIAIEAIVRAESEHWAGGRPGYFFWLRPGNLGLRLASALDRVLGPLFAMIAIGLFILSILVHDSVIKGAKNWSHENKWILVGVLAGLALEVLCLVVHILLFSTIAYNERVIRWDESLSLACVPKNEAGPEGARLLDVGEEALESTVGLSMSARYSLSSRISGRGPSSQGLRILLFSSAWKRRMYDIPRYWIGSLLLVHIFGVVGAALLSWNWRLSPDAFENK